jgi:hypothetical protein
MLVQQEPEIRRRSMRRRDRQEHRRRLPPNTLGSGSAHAISAKQLAARHAPARFSVCALSRDPFRAHRWGGCAGWHRRERPPGLPAARAARAVPRDMAASLAANVKAVIRDEHPISGGGIVTSPASRGHRAQGQARPSHPLQWLPARAPTEFWVPRLGATRARAHDARLIAEAGLVIVASIGQATSPGVAGGRWAGRVGCLA